MRLAAAILSGMKGARAARAMAIVVLVATGCDRSAASPPASVLILGPATPGFGVAGLVPPHFPDSTAADWTLLYDSLPETGRLVSVHVDWLDGSDAVAGTDPLPIPKAIEAAESEAPRRGVTPVIVLGFHEEAAGGQSVRPTLDWTDAAQVARYRDLAASIAARYRPPAIFLGSELNRLAAADPTAYDAVVAGLPGVADAVRTASPRTLVGTVFQYELLRGAGFLTGAMTGTDQWSLVDRLAGSLDVLGLTSYPFFDAESPADLPTDYYVEAAERSGLPIALTEVGWPSAPISVAPESGYGGSPDEQAAFIDRLAGLLETTPLVYAAWSFPYDVGPSSGPTFESVALRARDGTPKPALARWQALVAART